MATAVESPRCSDPTKDVTDEAGYVVLATSDEDKLADLVRRPFSEQAVAFLNAFWSQGVVFKENKSLCEDLWRYVALCSKLDDGIDGTSMDEFCAHRFLEKIENALTVREMRNALKDSGIKFQKRMSLLEFLIHHFKVDWRVLVNAPQGSEGDDERIAEAQSALDEACEAVSAATQARDHAKKEEISAVTSEKCAHTAEEAAKVASKAAKDAEAAASSALENARLQEMSAISAEKLCAERELLAINGESEAIALEKTSIHAEMESRRALEEAKKSEVLARNDEAAAFKDEKMAKDADKKAKRTAADALEVENQVQQALEMLEREEQAFKAKLDGLAAVAEDTSKGQVARNTAKAELAQLRCQDPLPLQRSKINQEAVLRRQARVTRSASSAAAAASQARKIAEEASTKAVASRESAEFKASHAATRQQQARDAAEAAADKRATAEKSREAATLASKEAQQARGLATEAREASEAASEKATQRREENDKAHSEAVQQRVVAVEAKELACQALLACEAAAANAALAYSKAQSCLERVKKECEGAGQGKLWWLSRELEDAKLYMSQAQLAKLSAASMA